MSAVVALNPGIRDRGWTLCYDKLVFLNVGGYEVELTRAMDKRL